MQVYLEVSAEKGQEPLIITLPGSRALVGKGSECDFELPFEGPDGPRFLFSEEQDRIFGASLGQFESRLKGRKLEEGLKTLILPGDELIIDRLAVKVKGFSNLAEGEENLGKLLVKEELGGSSPISTWPYLLLMNGPLEGTLFPLTGKKRQITIGRSSSCDLQLNDVDVSRKHSKISWKDNVFVVEDQKSKNGTLVNNARTGGRTPLSDRDDIVLGSTRITIVIPDLKISEPTKIADFEPTRLEERLQQPAGPGKKSATSANLTDWLLIGAGILLATAALFLIAWLLL
ncbi:MAG: FHA domain-containing protein [Deltaproteobacteria bacterium]|nr:FHA domain-containing protein [Deltaproteobacteria bacterium]